MGYGFELVWISNRIEMVPMNDKFEKLKGLKFETLQKILDNSYDEIFVVDKDQTILYVNPVCQANYGLTQDEIIGMKAYDLIDQGFCFPPVAPEVLKKKKRLTIEQTTIVGKKLVCTATPVFNENGEIELIVENSRDVTQIEMIKRNLEDAKELVKRYKEEVKELRKNEIQTLGIIAHSKGMKHILELSRHVAPTDSSILILGESGTGKGVLTKYIHKESRRCEGPFITINCAAIPESLLESELFGYKRGAFTGARREGKLGLVELANEGTLFFDEVAELPLHLQSKILQVIQEHRFIPVGGEVEKQVDVRIIAATNQNLKEMVTHNKFREDLYYRLCVVEIKIPPIRKRREDLMPLIYLFLNRYDKKYQTHHVIVKESLDRLVDYEWPGNVRELEHLMERLVVTVRETTILPEHLPADIHHPATKKMVDLLETPRPLADAVESVTKEVIVSAYHALGSSYKVAKKLKISQSKANRLIRRHVPDANQGINRLPS
jgi:PAS domain S-box-containing protein